MSDVTTLYRVLLESGEFSKLEPCNAYELNIKEKSIENWMALKPDLLFSDKDAVLIIAQEISGEALADLLAVDSQGNLIIIEIKRHWSDRNTVGQLLDYAARLSDWGYSAFNKRWKKFKGDNVEDLFEYFRNKFIDNPNFERDEFLKKKRLFILASEADEGLKRIIAWLRDEHNVPVDFVPFAFFKNGHEVYLRIEKIDVTPISIDSCFEGDWFFNSNETNSPGAWENMIKKNVIAAYGYGEESTKGKMDLPSAGDRVFVYVNGAGVIGAGKVLEQVSEQGNGIFNFDTKGDEFHRSVEWIGVVPIDKALKSSEVTSFGYNMPVRCTIGRWNNSKVAEDVLKELIQRSFQ